MYRLQQAQFFVMTDEYLFARAWRVDVEREGRKEREKQVPSVYKIQLAYILMERERDSKWK